MIRTRTLEPEEVQKAIDAGGPLQEMQIQPDKLREMAVCVVEVDDTPEGSTLPEAWRIVAYWVGWFALHLEPLWVHPDHRKSPAVIGGIVAEVQRMAEATREPVAYCEIADENLDVIAPYAERLGFHEAPGKLFYVMLQPAPEPVEG